MKLDLQKDRFGKGDRVEQREGVGANQWVRIRGEPNIRHRAGLCLALLFEKIPA